MAIHTVHVPGYATAHTRTRIPETKRPDPACRVRRGNGSHHSAMDDPVRPCMMWQYADTVTQWRMIDQMKTAPIRQDVAR